MNSAASWTWLNQKEANSNHDYLNIITDPFEVTVMIEMIESLQNNLDYVPINII